jgi:3-hydroxyisobutyrate dehydrogenase-like beta-hydroxyacid dehydrogenase
MQRIGFIGLGLMGQHMARRLLEAGYPLTVWNRTADKAAALRAAGAAWTDSPAALAKVSDVVVLMVTDSAASEQVVCGGGGVLEGARPGLVLIDMSSITPETSRSIAARAHAKRITMLDAPVTGAPKVASEGKLGIMVGGPKDAFEACLPIFKVLGVKIVHAGSNGMGTTLKLVNNLILGVAIHAAAEALVLAVKAGLDPQDVVEITSVGGARTGAMETRGPRMVQRDFSPHFSVNNMYKDLSNVVKLADECGVSLPVAGAAREILRAARSQGKGDLDSCAVMTILEAMANTTVQRKT